MHPTIRDSSLTANFICNPGLQHIPKAPDGDISRYGGSIYRPHSPLTDINPLNMTIVLNDPSLWPEISYFRGISYFQVACIAVVVYDWALTFGQEVG
ncbi:hypothetical protein AZE42_11176 [Rhizopogon vesiculosus]|uniref:DUF6533 domain-containing protein n=1 Tax=Rhizopogon vesiculosus TaxID=180088 RepID=A0A1J8PX55_9AGAM|nr:hypothetical protein AZE42_11176 [Rhizopogon vesiculosus]